MESVEAYILPIVAVAVAGFAASWCCRSSASGHKEDGAEHRPAPSSPPEPTPEEELIDFTEDSLRKFNGKAGQPIYIAVSGEVFNMSSHPTGPNFYGPGGPYAVFAGRDATIGLGMMLMKPEEWAEHSVETMGEDAKKTAADWAAKFRTKYRIVGRLSAPKSKDD